MVKERLDVLLLERGLVDSHERGRRLILAGQVYVQGQRVDKAANRAAREAAIEIRALPPYVGRGGQKLAHALATFGLAPAGQVAADVGASTGGFTDCLLQAGALRVYAIDVGYGQLSWSLRQDPRVVVMERTNARYLERLPEAVELVTLDVSFISLRLILPRVAGWLAPEGQVVALVKPQFEAGADMVGRGGVVRDPATHRQVLSGVITWAQENGWWAHGVVRSPLRGAKGNIEFLLWLSRQAAAPLPGLPELLAEATEPAAHLSGDNDDDAAMAD
ncbi:MAG: TlyA family RNA methyltransferase [Chloroflexota bacterium]